MTSQSKRSPQHSSADRQEAFNLTDEVKAAKYTKARQSVFNAKHLLQELLQTTVIRKYIMFSF